MPNRLIACITVRMSSERLPGKVMADIAGKPALARVVERYKQVGGLADLIVATTIAPGDDVVEGWCQANGVRCYRGAMDDVVLRIMDACVPLNPDYVIRGLGDCPFIEPGLVEMMADVVWIHGADCGRVFTGPNSWPVYGAAESPYSWESIVHMDARSSGSQREHFGAYLDQHRDEFDVVYPLPPSGYYSTYYRPYRLELDTAADAWLFNQIYKALGPDREPPLHEVIRFLDQNPDLAATNASIPEKTGPLTSYTPEERRHWSELMQGQVVDWTGMSWTRLERVSVQDGIWCDAGTCYLGHIEHHVWGQRNALIRPDGSWIVGDAVLTCRCGAGRRWYDSKEKK